MVYFVGGRVSRFLLRLFLYSLECVDEIPQPPQVAVFPVAFFPGNVVLQGLAPRKRCGLPEVDDPDLGFACVVVDEEERAANDLQTSRTQLLIHVSSLKS